MRLGLLSNDKLDPWVNWSTLAPPLFSQLEAMHGAKIIRPPPLRLARRSEWLEVGAAARSVDTFFWMQRSARPELPVHVASLLNPFARRSAYIFDAFEPQLSKIGILATVQRFDPCFVAYREASEELNRRFGSVRFEWLPFGIDSDVFSPSSNERPIFAFWMGRRYQPLHEALRSYCAERGLRYVFNETGAFLTPSELGALAGQSRYFVATPPDLDNPRKTGRFSPLVMRYLEGLSAGARLLGVLPRSGEYETLLPTDVICQVAPDGSDLARVLDRDVDAPEGWAAVEKASSAVRAHHSWKKRAEQIHARLIENRPIEVQRIDERALAGQAPRLSSSA